MDAEREAVKDSNLRPMERVGEPLVPHEPPFTHAWAVKDSNLRPWD